MASAAVPPRRLEAPARSARSNGDRDQSRLLPVLAVERALRAVVLIGVGLILLTHTHTDWADVARRFAEQIGFDPSRNEFFGAIRGHGAVMAAVMESGRSQRASRARPGASHRRRSPLASRRRA